MRRVNISSAARIDAISQEYAAAWESLLSEDAEKENFDECAERYVKAWEAMIRESCLQ